MDRPLLFFDAFYAASPHVGMGAYALRLLEGLTRRGAALPFALRAALPPWVAAEPVERAVGGVLRVSCPDPRHPLLRTALWRVALAREAASRGAGLFSPTPTWAPARPTPLAICHHDRIYRYFPRYLGRSGIRRLLAGRAEAYLRAADLIVTESRHAAQDLAHIPGVDPARIEVIRAWLPREYTPQAAAAAAPAVRRRHALPDRYWLYVGGYDYRKNVELLVSAYARVAAGPAVPPLVLAGRLPPERGPYCEMARALAAAGLPGGRILTPGFIPAEDMPGLYGGASLFIYPSRYEGFGLPPMEAMGCGCTALAADNSSLPEVVTDASHRFPADSVGALAALLDAAARGGLPFNPGFDRALFDEEAALDRYVEVLARLASAR